MGIAPRKSRPDGPLRHDGSPLALTSRCGQQRALRYEGEKGALRMQVGTGAPRGAAGWADHEQGATEVSSDGDPATTESRRRIHLLAALFAALAFGLLQLTLVQNGSAATGDVCARTGMETVSTDRANYTGGDTAHVTGTGYAPDCDVVVRITR